MSFGKKGLPSGSVPYSPTPARREVRQLESTDNPRAFVAEARQRAATDENPYASVHPKYHEAPTEQGRAAQFSQDSGSVGQQ